MNIEIRIDQDRRAQIASAVLRRAAAAALAQQSAPSTAALTILVTGDAEIQALNRDFMGSDAPTDVLSFPSGEPLEDEGGEIYVGDIIISLERAAEQAAQAGHSLAQEVELLTVHGVLHLLGHDHASDAEKAAMWAAQAAVLEKLKNPLSPP